VICLEQDDPLVAVGLHYDAFGAIEDSEVRRLVDQAARRPKATW
jgi:predicted phosphoribosyltransferase